MMTEKTGDFAGPFCLKDSTQPNDWYIKTPMAAGPIARAEERAVLAEVKKRPEGSPLSRAEAYVWDNRVDWPAVLWLLAIGFGAGYFVVWAALALLGRASF